MAISIPIRVEDNRERSWLLNVLDIPLDETVELVKAHPKARFILLNGLGYTGSPLGRKDNGLPANYAIELSRLSAVLANELGQLIANLGAERLMFGTGMPFNYPDPALVKLEVLNASDADKEKICSQNAMTWLQL
jgi:predicted TIM-barrel fold metal-dependent hydrolase